MAKPLFFSHLLGCWHGNHQRRTQSKKKSLEEVSLSTGISKTTLWEIERGSWLPDPDQAAKLRQVLGIPGLPDSSQVISQRQMRQICRPHPVDWSPANPVPWARMEKVFYKQLKTLSVARTLFDWMKECLAADSPLECLFLYALAAAGAKPIIASPHALGYRAQCILGREGKALGERSLPGLLWEVDKTPCLLWPQVTVLTPRGSFRIDVLVLICDSWKTIELNGKNHDLLHDRFRASVLGHEPIVIDNDAIRSLNFVEPLKAELRKLIPKRRSRAEKSKQEAS